MNGFLNTIFVVVMFFQEMGNSLEWLLHLAAQWNQLAALTARIRIITETQQRDLRGVLSRLFEMCENGSQGNNDLVHRSVRDCHII